MRHLVPGVLALFVVAASARAEEPPRNAPPVVLRSADGKKTYDLGRMAADGPVLVRLTCACSGCDRELPYFQKLQEAYGRKGLTTLAVFREQPADAARYAEQKGLRFPWVDDAAGRAWKAFGATAMPTNILIAPGGRVVKVVAGCKTDGRNAQLLSGEIARLLHADEAKVAPATVR